MKNTHSAEELRAMIVALENKRDEEWLQLKDQFHDTIKNKILAGTFGLASGYVSKVLVKGKNHSLLSNVLGTVVQMGVSTVVAKNTDSIKMLLAGVLKFFTKKKSIEPSVESNL